MRRPAAVMLGLLTVTVVLCCIASVTIHRWTQQGDEVSLLAPSEWGFGSGWWDGQNTGGSFYRYGFFVRTTGLHPPHRP